MVGLYSMMREAEVGRHNHCLGYPRAEVRNCELKEVWTKKGFCHRERTWPWMSVDEQHGQTPGNWACVNSPVRSAGTLKKRFLSSVLSNLRHRNPGTQVHLAAFRSRWRYTAWNTNFPPKLGRFPWERWISTSRHCDVNHPTNLPTPAHCRKSKEKEYSSRKIENHPLKPTSNHRSTWSSYLKQQSAELGPPGSHILASLSLGSLHKRTSNIGRPKKGFQEL